MYLCLFSNIDNDYHHFKLIQDDLALRQKVLEDLKSKPPLKKDINLYSKYAISIELSDELCPKALEQNYCQDFLDTYGITPNNL